MSQADETTPAREARYHNYTGSRIPWYVHLLWILFWVFAAYYLAKYLAPVLQVELR